MPTLVRQPDESSLCGQCCIAMASGVSLDRACEVVGHRRLSGTDTKELRKALCALGIATAPRCKRVNRQLLNLPKRAILAAHSKGRRRGHWMLLWDGEVYDPEGRWPDLPGWYITSYLELYT